jgi:hypothetical protein
MVKLCRCESVQPMAAWKMSWSLDSFAPPGTRTRRHTGGSMPSRRMRSWKTGCCATPAHYVGRADALKDPRTGLADSARTRPGLLMRANLIAHGGGDETPQGPFGGGASPVKDFAT